MESAIFHCPDLESRYNPPMLIYFLPIVAAVFYALNYAVLGRVLSATTVATYIFYSTIFSLFTAAVVVTLNKDTINLSAPLQDKQLGLWILVSALASFGGWIFTLLSIQNISPTFAAMAEVVYPVFVPVFAYWLFAEKQWDNSTIFGGALIFIGLAIMIYGKSRG